MPTMQGTSPSKHAQKHVSPYNPSFSPQLDESLEKLAPSEYDMIVRSLRASSDAPAPTPTTALPFPTLPSPRERQDPTPISHHLRSTIRLFNLLSSKTDIDHPLCAECTQILLSSLQRNLDELKKERNGYLAFEKEVRRGQEKGGDGVAGRRKGEEEEEEEGRKIERLIVEERIAVEALREAERERVKLDEELCILEEEEKALREEEAE